jgi:hypothetical protein
VKTVGDFAHGGSGPVRGEDYPGRSRPLVVDGHVCGQRRNGHDLCIRPRGHAGDCEFWDEANVDFLPEAVLALRRAG